MLRWQDRLRVLLLGLDRNKNDMQFGAGPAHANQTGGAVNLDQLAVSLDAFERVDKSEFQRRARVLQSMWRQERGIPCGEHHGPKGSRPLGSRLDKPEAESLANYLTEVIRDVVNKEVRDEKASAGKLFGKPRIFNDLLSSQPLCFNLFGELTCDLSLASAVVNSMTDGRFTAVTKIDFEWSPGRRDPRYLNDRSAFDVFLRCCTAAGGKGFIGIEVKYHENLAGLAGGHKSEYDNVADKMGCFREDREPLKKSPMQQIWRDHLLAGITRIVDGYDDGLFVTLYPKDNLDVANALSDYRAHLLNEGSFAAWTLEDFIGHLQKRSDAAWIELFGDRYLAFEKLDRSLGAAD